MTDKKNNYWLAAAVFVGLPVLFWSTHSAPERSILKEVLSLAIILALTVSLGQFLLSRCNPAAACTLRPGRAIKLHKTVGYIIVFIMLIHPVLVVYPRYFEAGITPKEAFMTIITQFDSRGVVLGMAAWCLIVTIGITALFRKFLPLSYITWRWMHGVLSFAFIICGVLHAIDLGRHSDSVMSVYLITLAVYGALLLLRTYIQDLICTTKETAHETC